MKQAIRKAPVVVGFKVQDDFKKYTSGLYKPIDCGTVDKASLNHAMLAIGFGTMGLDEYILVKNSWGSLWGEQGYAYIYADRTSVTGTCGIYLDNYSVVLGANFVENRNFG